jgi:hypothetical protein
MKTKFLCLFALSIVIFIFASSVYADGNHPGPNQQSYPIPQLYPITQYPNQNNYPGPVPNPQYQQPPAPFSPQPWQNGPQPFDNKPQDRPNNPGPVPYPFQPNNTDMNRIYDPVSGQYFYHIPNDQDPYPYQYYYPQQYQNNQYGNVQYSKQYNPNGSVSLNWLIYNRTNENWGNKNVDIKCVAGCHLLTEPNRTLWDLPYSVPRNGSLSFSVNIWQPMYGESITFSIVAGSKTLYTFTINPN